ncbi:MAG: hypothetical protein J7L11_09655 [Thermoprotei archaeon]|nr:hypothetical protein [Thermoprotei archaeon]
MNAIDELQLAGRLLTRAEEELDEGNELNVKSLSRNIIGHAASAVIVSYLGEDAELFEGLIQVMEHVSQRLWIEVLRLLEILRQVDEEDTFTLINMAREAIEIASSLVLMTLGEG